MIRRWLPEFGACFAILFCGVFVHLVRGEGMYAGVCLHMRLPPFAEDLPTKKTKKCVYICIYARLFLVVSFLSEYVFFLFVSFVSIRANKHVR